VRILVLNQYFHPDRSATSQLLTELCEDLARTHQVFVVTGRPSYNPVAETDSGGLVSLEWHQDVRVARVWSTRFDRSGMLKRLTNYATYLACSIVGALRVNDPDVVIALTDPPPIGLIGLGVARLRRKPFILVVKDIFPDVAIRLGVIGDGATVRVLRWLQHLLFSEADQLVSIGRDMDVRLEGLGVPRAKVTTIHDWTDGGAVEPLDHPSKLRAAQGWGNRFVVMHSGNVGLSQDLDSVVDAAELLQDDTRIVFAIVGEGASKERLQRAVRDRRLGNVAFLPYQEKEDLADSLGAADLHLVTLKSGLTGYIVPSKLYGILAAGKPFIAAIDDWSEPALIAREHGCGVAVPSGDAKLLAQAISSLAATDELDEMGNAGRRALEERFDRRRAVDAYRELLASVRTAE
jgi:colanic acid biosynthesis glycosyl transferase WcaI